MDREKKESYGIKEEVISWIRLLAIVVIIALVVNNYIIVNANIPSASMETTIMTGDRLIANRLAYIFSEPERGDIVVFYGPDEPEELFVKRVIGMPGDEVVIENQQVYVNGDLLVEPYIKEEMFKNDGPFEVPKDHYFVMGDNRNNSADSRAWNNTYLSEDAIVGKVILRYYPNPQMIEW